MKGPVCVCQVGEVLPDSPPSSYLKCFTTFDCCSHPTTPTIFLSSPRVAQGYIHGRTPHAPRANATPTLNQPSTHTTHHHP